jgi:soluble lytic murein transglycosylase
MMQVIPTTAERVSKHLKIPFDLNKIKNDFEHNIKIGSTYLKMLKNYYGGSYVLTISAYNAGENAADKWIGRYGDPRKMKDTHQVVDWLENIPYFTTRNYAQRVLENMQERRYYIKDNKVSASNLEIVSYRKTYHK